MNEIYRKTNRGFELVEFIDTYGVKGQIQESSAGSEAHLWIGTADASPTILATDAARLGLPTFDKTSGWVPYNIPREVLLKTELHMNREQVQTIVKRLQHWLDTGELKYDGESEVKEN